MLLCLNRDQYRILLGMYLLVVLRLFSCYDPAGLSHGQSVLSARDSVEDSKYGERLFIFRASSSLSCVYTFRMSNELCILCMPSKSFLVCTVLANV